MSNETKNLPTAAVISDRRATGGSDMATHPDYQPSVDNSSIPETYQCSKALGRASHVPGGHRCRIQPDAAHPDIHQDHQDSGSTTQAGGGRPLAGSDLEGTRLRAEHPSASGCPLDGSDPYAWFAHHGQRLHAVSIGILARPRSNGVLYTGVFNIDGFIYTVGAPSVEGLCLVALAKRQRHQQSIRHHQEQKRTRCASRYLDRYPGAELPVWLAPSEN